MNEKRMRGEIVKILKPIGAFAVENGAHDGCPDICTVAGWIELKIGNRPVREDTRVAVELRPAQVIWMNRWIRHGGQAWTITKINELWLLHHASWSTEHLGKVCERELRSGAIDLWDRTPKSGELITALLHQVKLQVTIAV